MSSPSALLSEARHLLDTRAADLRGTWPRAVALLGRQSLEGALDAFWHRHAPGAEEASRAAQLLCLASYLDDLHVVRGVRYAWHGFSRACHHHVYELSPTAIELESLLTATAQFVEVASALERERAARDRL